MERSLTAASRAQVAPDPPIPGHPHSITCMKKTNQFPEGRTAMVTRMDMAIVEDSGQ